MRDDGVGITDEDAGHGHWGLQGMRERAQRLGADGKKVSTRAKQQDIVDTQDDLIKERGAINKSWTKLNDEYTCLFKAYDAFIQE